MIGKRFNQKNANVITWAKVETIKVPTLLMTGDSDLWTPPSILRLQASHLKHAEVRVIREAGHAPSWEQPEAFNAALLDFHAAVIPPDIVNGPQAFGLAAKCASPQSRLAETPQTCPYDRPETLSPDVTRRS